MAHASPRRARSVRSNANCRTACSTTYLLSALLFGGIQSVASSGSAHHHTTPTNTSHVYHLAPQPADAQADGVVANHANTKPGAAGSNLAARLFRAPASASASASRAPLLRVRSPVPESATLDSFIHPSAPLVYVAHPQDDRRQGFESPAGSSAHLFKSANTWSTAPRRSTSSRKMALPSWKMTLFLGGNVSARFGISGQ